MVRAGVGIETAPIKEWLAGTEIYFEHRGTTRDETLGELLNSGGQLGVLKGYVSYALAPHLSLGIDGNLPLYYDVNGQQIVQSWGVGLSLGGTFLAKEKVHKPISVDPTGHDHNEASHLEHDKHVNQGGVESTLVSSELKAVAASDKRFGQREPLSGLKSVQEFRNGGESFRLEEAFVPGKWVVLDFWAEWCAPCIDVSLMLTRKAGSHPDLIIKKVEVPSFDTEVAKEHLSNVNGLPLVWLMDPKGKLVKKFEAVDLVTLEEQLDSILNK